MNTPSEAARPGGALRPAALSVAARNLRPIFWAIAVAIGGLHALAGAARQSMNADGIAYLDMGDAFWRGDWPMAVNAVWSPLYGWVLGLALRVAQPAPAWEFRLAHLVNFVIYLGALACFEFFWRQLARYRQGEGRAAQEGVGFPEWAWWALGYSLFIWTALHMVEMWAVTPDMGVAALVYLAAGMLVRIRLEPSRWGHFALLGAVLGLGYLAKAVMFPLAFVFAAAAVVAAGSPRRAAPLLLVTLAAFLLVAGPFIGALSAAKGRLTFGETGKLTYAWFVDGVPYPHWQGETPGAGAPGPARRQTLARPPLYAFDGPVGGTYPVAYDPSYWYEGVAPFFDLRGQIRSLVANGQYYFDLLALRQGGLLACVVVLGLMGTRALRAPHLRLAWSLALPATAAFGMYALVYAEDRYLGPFMLLLWAAALCVIRLPHGQEAQRLLARGSAVMLLFMGLSIAAFNLEGLDALVLRRLVGEPTVSRARSLGAPQAVDRGTPPEVAAALTEAGLRPGDKVAFLGYSFDASWARLARVRIIAEMHPYDPTAFWGASPEVQARVVAAFANAGARAVVAEPAASAGEAPGWRRLGETGYTVLMLTDQ